MSKKAFDTLVFISRGIEYRSWDILLQLYKTLVKPHLEYCVQFYSLCYSKNVIKQRTFLRMLPGLEALSYRERFGRDGLFSMECRRLKGDLIQVYKIMKGINRVNA